jgi:TRAP-type uncharacterized transport system substrate-binding protein
MEVPLSDRGCEQADIVDHGRAEHVARRHFCGQLTASVAKDTAFPGMVLFPACNVTKERMEKKESKTLAMLPKASMGRLRPGAYGDAGKRLELRRTMRVSRAAMFALTVPGLIALVLTAAPAQEVLKPRPAPRDDVVIRDHFNAWTVGLAAGLLEGAPIRFAAEIARVVNDNEMHVLPVMTRGPTENVNDLLYLEGIDVAIVNRDSFDEYRSQVPQVSGRIVQLLSLFPSELHVFVRPEITSLSDLAGKKVNFNTQGTAAAYSGPLIFSRLGIDVDKSFLPHPVALEMMRRGEIAAVVFVTSKPVDAFKGKWERGFKFVPVAYGPKLADYYVPAALTSSDYPALIPSSERVTTIAVPTVLVSYNWKPGTPRYLKMAHFVENLFGRMDRLRSPGFDPKWKEIDLSVSAPGLARFKAAQDWLDRKVTEKSGARQ